MPAALLIVKGEVGLWKVITMALSRRAIRIPEANCQSRDKSGPLGHIYRLVHVVSGIHDRFSIKKRRTSIAFYLLSKKRASVCRQIRDFTCENLSRAVAFVL